MRIVLWPWPATSQLQLITVRWSMSSFMEEYIESIILDCHQHQIDEAKKSRALKCPAALIVSQIWVALEAEWALHVV